MHDKKNMNQKHLLRAVVRIHAYGKPVDITKPFLLQNKIKKILKVTKCLILSAETKKNPFYISIVGH